MNEFNQNKYNDSYLPLFNFIKERRPATDIKKMLELLPNSIIGCCEQGKINYWNNQSEKLFGWTQNEVLGQGIERLINSPGFSWSQKWKTFTDQTLNMTGLHKSGHTLPLEITVKSINHKKKASFFAFVNDSQSKNKMKARIESLTTENKILKQIFPLIMASPSDKSVISVFLKEIASLKNCELAFVCENDKNRLKRIDLTCNKTSLLFEDFSDQIDIELSKLASKKFPILSKDHSTTSIQDIQSSWDNPLFIFGRNFGFHGLLTLPVRVRDESIYYLFFLSTQFMVLQTDEQNLLKESIKTLEQVLTSIKK